MSKLPSQNHRFGVVYTPIYTPKFFGFEKLHPADTKRFSKIANHLIQKKILLKKEFHQPKQVTRTQLAKVHDETHLIKLESSHYVAQALEFPFPSWVPNFIIKRKVLRPFQLAVGGTMLATKLALEYGLGINLAGGYHHARKQMAHGFCLYADVAMSIHHLRENGFLEKVLIVDTDAHQGDGNHSFFAQDSSVYSFSIHEQDIFPFPKLHGDCDIGVETGIEDQQYLRTLHSKLTDIVQQFSPALIFHVAGADILHDDPLTGMNITTDGLLKRDSIVFEMAINHHIPFVYLLAGGYGPSSAKSQALSIEQMIIKWNKFPKK